jgi:hypothetical protein
MLLATYIALMAVPEPEPETASTPEVTSTVTQTPAETPSPTPAPSEEVAAEEETQAEPVLKWVKVNSSGLRIREEPNTTSRVLAVLVSGDTVPVFEERDGWYLVQFIVIRGWIKADFVVETEHVISDKNTAERAQEQSKVDWEVNCDNVDPFDGYYYRGNCIPGMISADTAYTTYPANSIGGMAHYAPGVMEEMAANKGFSLKNYVDGERLPQGQRVLVWTVPGG